MHAFERAPTSGLIHDAVIRTLSEALYADWVQQDTVYRPPTLSTAEPHSP